MSSSIVLESFHSDTLFFEVESTSRRGIVFDVWIDKTNYWLCSCEQYYYRRKFCKHMKMVRDHFDKYLRDEFPDFDEVIHSDIVYEEVRI